MSFSGKAHQTPEKTIQNQPFWPDLELADFVDNYRIPSDLPEGTVTGHLINAAIQVNSRLVTYRAEQRQSGYEHLEQVPSEVINGQSIQVTLYHRAVCCMGKASVLRDFASIDRREPAENQAKTGEETEDRYLQYVDEALCRFLNIGDINVELI
ncbi:head completion/stabilization protein [Endozoicomonas montiporae]|uniref:Head completion protein n=1 Tax=Endozoicomonas montiporae CL-33 TaxID=570277 RepID=A0A142BB55_9GAMM|nr:head completion/stabilization protein [Endozoicomonas montiporae]AMO55981.1 head completion protein [Endozoicomonas montiporae CL-33]